MDGEDKRYWNEKFGEMKKDTDVIVERLISSAEKYGKLAGKTEEQFKALEASLSNLSNTLQQQVGNVTKKMGKLKSYEKSFWEEPEFWIKAVVALAIIGLAGYAVITHQCVKYAEASIGNCEVK